MKRFKKLAIPYFVWMIIFIGFPLVIMLIFAFSNVGNFSPLSYDFSGFRFSFDAFERIFSQTYLKAFGRSMKYSFITSACCFLVGYPIAYIISKSKFKNKYLMLLIFILPMWTNMLLRIKTVNDLFRANSLLNMFNNLSIDLTSQVELKLIVVMTLVYLPFMIFPIFTVLDKMDNSLIEASADLGCGPIKTFFKVTFPLSAKGVVSGVIMTLLPCAFGFTIPHIVSDRQSQYWMLGNLLERQFKSSSINYNVGSAVSLLVLILILGSLYLITRVDAEGETLL